MRGHKKEKPRTYVLEPMEDARRAGRTAVLRVNARAPGNQAIARQFYRWLKGRDHYEGKSIELEIPASKKAGAPDVTAIVTIAMDVTAHGHTVVHMSIPHAGKGHYDIYHYRLYAVDAKNRRHAFPIPEPAEEEHFDDAPFERLSDFPEGERFSLSPERHRHILDDDVDIVVRMDEPRYSVPLDVPSSSRAHELFDEAFEELQDLANDRRLSKKQRKQNAKGMKRFRDVHDRLMDQERRRDLKVEHNWVTETLRMMKESEDAGWYGQAERFLKGGPGGSVLARAAREDEMREQLRKQHHLHRALEQGAREQEAQARLRQQQHDDALQFIRRTRAKEQGSPSGAYTDVDAHIGALLDGGGGSDGEGVNAAHMLRIGTLLLDCITLAGDTGDADMIAKLGTLAQVCGHCDHVGACHHRCKHCKHAAYCNTDCARADWTRHREEECKK